MKSNSTAIAKVVMAFAEKSVDMAHRYNSFDLCYAHFRQTKEKLANKTPSEQQIEQSCYVLWGYLSSWGMLRNSFLFQRNPAYLKPLVEWIYAQEHSAWELDVPDYQTKKAEIIRLYQGVEENIKPMDRTASISATLVTKTLLGVFGVVPAYDRYFKQTFIAIGKSKNLTLGKFENSLRLVHQFYLDNQTEIDRLSHNLVVRDFDNQPTQYHYTKAKIIDMYGFQESYDPASDEQ